MGAYSKEQQEEKPVSTGNYLNKFEEGDNKIRIIKKPITGYEYWREIDGERKPVRLKALPKEMPEEALPAKYGDKIKYFEAFEVWNYAAEKIQIMQLTQVTIYDGLMNYDMNDDWGDLRHYDVTIKKTKEGDRTSYDVMASPPTELSEEIANASAEIDIDLEDLFDGKDPFKKD
ncbi:hypothetical protein LCGC14_0417820 [marine sediment metagenome]|uniref:Bacteriophage T4 Gp32 single-stranded DNA-binding domain-containing protein n=1 Tax=marine sediment metagenome TaxID=412755 RepID=A0A0F9VDQ9_9ZZZZ